MKTSLIFLALFLPLSLHAAIQQPVAVRAVDTVADMRMVQPEVVSLAERSGLIVRGYYQRADWGEGRIFYYNKNSTNVVDDGCTFASEVTSGNWEAPDCQTGVFDVRYFGAFGNAVVNDLERIRAAGDALQHFGRGTLRFPAGIYRVEGDGYPVATFAGLTDVNIEAKDSIFTSEAYNDATFTSVYLVSTGGVATATWSAPHGLSAGRRFAIKDSSDLQYEGTWIVASSNSPTAVTFILGAYNNPTGPATALARAADISQVLFRFDACTNVNFGKVTFRGTVLPRDVQYWMGWTVLQFRKNCKTLRGEVDAQGASYGLWSGEYGFNYLGGCDDFDVASKGKYVGYPVSLWGSGHNSKFRIDADEVHRAAYVGGVRGSDFDIRVKNFDVAGVIATHQPDTNGTVSGCEDTTFRVVDTGTTEPIKLLSTGGTRWLAILNGYAATNDVSMRNLRFWVSCKDAPVTGGFLCQTFATNQYIAGLEVGGYMDQRGLNSTNFRYPWFIYETSPSVSGRFDDVVFRNLKVLQPADPGNYRAYLRLANCANVLFDDVSLSGVSQSVALKTGSHLRTVPSFPDWTHDSFEAGQVQRASGAIIFSDSANSRALGQLQSSIGSSDATIQWVGRLPTSSDYALFSVSSTNYATNASLSVSVTSDDLRVRLYGTNASSWRQVLVTNWASRLKDRVVSLGVVRTTAGISVYTDGHQNEILESSFGSSVAWTNNIEGTLFCLGVEEPLSSFSGPVYRAAVWNYDKSQEFPSLAFGWRDGEILGGAATNLISPTISNGGFETLGSPFAIWTCTTAGSSAITVSSNSHSGLYALKMSVDAFDSFAGFSQTGTVPGQTYRVSFWARAPLGGNHTQIDVLGAADGDNIFTLTPSWAQYTMVKPWTSSAVTFKRWNLTGAYCEIDDVTVSQIGSLLDFDWTRSAAENVTGKFATILGGAETRVNARGAGVSADRGDNSVSLEAGQDYPIQVWRTALGGMRSVTLQTNHSLRGDSFLIVREAAGTSALVLSTSPVLSLYSNSWAKVVYDSTGWKLAAKGRLSEGAGSGLDADLLDGMDSSVFLNYPVRSVFGRTGDVTAQSGDYTASQISFLDEWIDDRVGTLIVGRTNILATYNDAGNVLYLDYTGPTSTGLSDAPADGKFYGRKDTNWVEVATNHISGLSNWMSTKSNTNHTHVTGDVTSGTFVAERLGTGTPTTNTFLQGNGAGNSAMWATLPSTPSPTNGITDAPADSVFYGRKNNSWTQPSRTDISGISTWGQSWLDASVVSNATTAATYLTLIGGSPLTIDSPAQFVVRRQSSGTGYTHHRLNIVTGTGLTTALYEDVLNDETVAEFYISTRDFGDITTSSLGATWTIDTDAITTAKIQDNAVTTNKLQTIAVTNTVLAVTTATGVPRAVPVGTGLITTPNTLQLNIAAGTDISFATNGQGQVTINSTASTTTALPTLIGWVKFAVGPLFSLTTSEYGGSVNSVNLVAASDSQAIDLGVGFSGTFAVTYHVTCEIEDQNSPTGATYLPKWWIKQGSKTTSGFNFMASLWDYYGAGSAPVGDIFTLWIWRRE